MIDFLDSHAMWVVMLLLILIAVELLIAIRPRKQNTRKSASGGEDPILKEVSQNSQMVSILYQRENNMVKYVSENLETIIGLKPERVYTDLNVLETLMTQEERLRVNKSIQKQKETADTVQEEIQMKLPGQEAGTIKMTCTPTRDNTYVLMSLEDISKEQQTREDLKRQIAEVVAIDESKTQFLSKMSHEIRTPMNGMLGMISLAKLSQESEDYQEARDYLDKAEGLTQFLLSIINDILDMSRIESGKMELEHAEFAIADLAEKLRSMFETTITEKGIGFHLEMNDFTVKNVIGDELRISQVLTNFLSNASKFTSPGGNIYLMFRQMEVLDGKVSIMLRVKDDGIGMPPEFLSRIFVPFEQQDSGTARKFGGSGLGMAIADNLVRQMGGQILVDSEVGKGTEFTVFLELPVGSEQEETKAASDAYEEISIEGRRLLMAEDNDVNALVAGRLLGHQGLVIERVANGQEAVDAFDSHEAGYFDAILMDIHMPVMDGWEATKAIRALARPDGKKIPIIALSADAFVEDKRYSVEIGMNNHVAKPIDYEELKQVLCECLAEEQAR